MTPRQPLKTGHPTRSDPINLSPATRASSSTSGQTPGRLGNSSSLFPGSWLTGIPIVDYNRPQETRWYNGITSCDN